MKTLRTLTYLLIAIVTIATTSCKTDDDGGDGGAAASGTLIATVDGDNYESEVAGTSATRVNAGGITTIVLNANSTAAGSNKVFAITMNGIDSEGTYDIGGGANISINALYIEGMATGPSDPDVQTWQAPFDDTVAGEMNISEITDTKIEGTFSFVGTNAEDQSTRTITEGSFNINF